MHIELDNNTQYIISALNKSGFEAYAVGGCVRNSLIGREVVDYDIATSAAPNETKKVFSSYPVIETGIKHGTVAVIFNSKPYEITTYRVESSYTDSRHPDSVAFVQNLEADLARRDFTVNALAYHPQKGVIDLFGGVRDLNSGVIRAVGNAHERFSEDALRILRALRFASVLGFSIEPSTAEAIMELKHTLLQISPERIYSELKKLVCGKNSVNIITEFSEAISQVLPINSDPKLLSRLPDNCIMRFTYLCGVSVTDALVKLRADNAAKNTCKLLAESMPIPNDITELKKYISSLGRENSLLVASYRRALYGEDIDLQTEKLLSGNECLFLHDLAVNGNDLSALGITGKAVGQTLSALLSSVLSGDLENKREVLLARVKDIDFCLN